MLVADAARRFSSRIVLGAGALVLAGGMLGACSSSSSGSSSGNVLLVGDYHGKAGKYTSIQDAVNAAKSGDWILIAPGDYHEQDDYTTTSPDPAEGAMGGVYITTPNLHLRGIDRNTVVVDGTKPGSSQCSADPAAQSTGPTGPTASPSAATGSWCGRPTTSASRT